MSLVIAAFIGGVLTIASPCILPVLPFVFARGGRPFRSHGLPLLVGMGATFAMVASLATVGGGWIVDANEYGRRVALVLLAGFGLALLLPSMAERISRPVVALGSRLSATPSGDARPASSIWSPVLLGIGTGLLWTPCAGPILGVILTGAALHGASVDTLLLLMAYAAGACTSLAAALLFGGRLLAPLRRSMAAGEHLRKLAGAAVLAGVALVVLDARVGVLARLSSSSTFATATTTAIEQAITRMVPVGTAAAADVPALPLRVEGTLPSLQGATEWINSPPLTAAGLRGKVVLIDFWTYSCINCLRTTPYLKAWADTYRDAGLVVIGVHAPEFAFEKRIDNVRRAIRDLGITYPVAVDNDFAIWREAGNQYWPAFYLVDAQGRIRHHQFGEGGYDMTERAIRQLLAEAGQRPASSALVSAVGDGVQAAAGIVPPETDETYLGHARASAFASPGGLVPDVMHAYDAPPRLAANQWALSGNWTADPESIVADRAGAHIALRFRARDVHLVLGPPASGHPARFKVRIDGKPPGADHGSDVDADGNGTIDAQRLYQLVRQSDGGNGSGGGMTRDRIVDIEFLDAGTQAYVFTFG